MKYPTNADTGEYLNATNAAHWARSNGTNFRPDPPRNLIPQSGPRKVLVTWDAPMNSSGITGWRIYLGTELALLDSIFDPNVRRYSVDASAGASPPNINIFVSSVSKRGESVRVQVQGKATAETGAPAEPSPPPSSAATGDTGGTFGIDNGDSSSPPLL